MRDYTLEGTPVAQLKTEIICELLDEGFEIVNEDGNNDTIEGVAERLKLELFIRERGLRNG